MRVMRRSVFKDPNKLSLTYIPPRIPYRESKLSQLKEYFENVIIGKLNYEHVFITGNTGTGKTLVAKHFERYIYTINKEHDKSIIPIYVNARLERSPGNIIRKMISTILPGKISRGYSLEEIYSGFLSYLIDNDKKAILILDDADHLFTMYPEFIYKLSRAEEASPNFTNYLSIIFVVHRDDILNNLDPWTAAGLHKNIVKFEDYSYKELRDILLYRSSEAFNEGAITIQTINTAADITTAYNYNARYAIELLYKAGLIADKKGEEVVKPEHVREARVNSAPAFSLQELESLQNHEKLLLYTLAETLSLKEEAYVTMGDLERRYREIASLYGLKPVGHTWIWKMVNMLSTLGYITKKISGEGHRGKTSLIGLPSLPATLLMKELQKILKRDINNG